MLNKHWLAATLSVSLCVSALAGCGTSPTASPTDPAAKASNGQTPNTMVNVPADPRAQEGTQPATPGQTPTNGGAAPAPAQPGANPAQPTDGQPGAQPVGPVGPPVGPGGAVVSPGIGGGLQVGPPPVFGPEGLGGLVAFMSDRATGGGNVDCIGKDCKDFNNFDIFVYDALAATVLALPGVNTFGNEVNPRLSSNGAWLIYQSDEAYNNDILLFDLRNQLINTLSTLNTPWDETMPDVSDDGRMIVYVSNEIGAAKYFDGFGRPGKDDHDGHGDHDRKVQGTDDKDWDKDRDPKARKKDHKFYDLECVNELRIYDVLTGNNYRVPVANRGLVDITWPSISGNGAVIAYGGSTVFDLDESDIFVYSLLSAAQLTPPFVNSPFGDYNPDLDVTGSMISFVSNRRGSEDIYVTDLQSGFTDNMVLANSICDEQEPRWLAGPGGQLIFQSDRTGTWSMFAYDMATALLDTMPVANEPFANTMLREEFPDLLGIRDLKKWKGGHR